MKLLGRRRSERDGADAAWVENSDGGYYRYRLSMPLTESEQAVLDSPNFHVKTVEQMAETLGRKVGLESPGGP